MKITSIIDTLFQADEPSVRFKILVNVLGEKLESDEIKKLQQEIKSSSTVKSLLSGRNKSGKIPFHPYAKWYGAHWVLASLAELSYPAGDESLFPLREQVYDWLFSSQHDKNIKTINGLVRAHASMEGNALFYLLSLGIADERTEKLVERLLDWQWLDGGWNCDPNPKAKNSSFMETLLPLRGLALYAKLTGNREAKKSAERAAEIFLKRKLFKKKSGNKIISDDFVKLHYPCYWHYDILFGLKVMAEAEFIKDKRCQEALDLLESKRLADGGFPAEMKYYKITDKLKSGYSPVDWGGMSKKWFPPWRTHHKKMNLFVTVDALEVLKKSGRLVLPQ